MVKVKLPAKKITSKVTRTFGDIKVTAEFSDTSKGFYFRLRTKYLIGPWSAFFPGIYTLRVGNRIFALLTNYWESENLKCEHPIEIVEGKYEKD